jgi:hypothetical protein
MAITRGIPECVTPLPGRGEGRNHDLVLVGRSDAGQVTICVEAKADEAFGEVVGKYLAQTKKKAAAEGRRTNLPARASALVQLLFGPDASSEAEPWRSLRYQLLTGAAGALLQADLDGSEIAVFVVHEFLTEAVDRGGKVRANASDLEKFVGALVGESHGSKSVGNLAGPVRFSTGKFLHRPLSLLLGKVTFDWRRTHLRVCRG